MAEPISTGAVIRAGAAVFGLFGFGNHERSPEWRRAQVEAARRVRGEGKPSSKDKREIIGIREELLSVPDLPAPKSPPPIPRPSSGAFSVGARVPSDFLSLSRSLVGEGGGFVFGLTGGLLGSAVKIGREILKRIPKQTRPRTRPKPQPVPGRGRTRRRRIEKPKRGFQRREELINPQTGQPIPRAPAPTVPATAPGSQTIPRTGQIPETIAKPQPPIPKPQLPPVALVNPFAKLAQLLALGLGGAAVGRIALAGRSAKSPRPALDLVPSIPSAQPFAPVGPKILFPSPTAVPSPLGLRQINPIRGQAQSLQTQLQRCQQTARRCEKRRRKNRKTCNEGFYRETATKTEFVSWRKYACGTNQTIFEK